MADLTRPIEVPIRPLMKHLTIHVNVTGVRAMTYRQWLGIRLMKMAASVMGCNIRVHVTPKQGPFTTPKQSEEPADG